MTIGGSPASRYVMKRTRQKAQSRTRGIQKFPDGYNVNLLKLSPPIYKKCKQKGMGGYPKKKYLFSRTTGIKGSRRLKKSKGKSKGKSKRKSKKTRKY